MLFDLFTNPILFLAGISGLIVAVTIHEFSHALIADRLGDPTPRINGRLTLNPLAHLDPIGTLMLFLTRFGWGKPVPIDTYNLENPRRDAALISLAGPASNLILAIILSVFLKIISASSVLPIFYSIITPIIMFHITINISLAIFNLLPIPPLDGSKILLGFLPSNIAFELTDFLEQYGFALLFFLVFPFFGQSLISYFISPIISFILHLLL